MAHRKENPTSLFTAAIWHFGNIYLVVFVSCSFLALVRSRPRGCLHGTRVSLDPVFGPLKPYFRMGNFVIFTLTQLLEINI